MNSTKNIFLPGAGQQFKHLKENINLKEKRVLIIGSNSEQVGMMFLREDAASANIIVDDHDSLMNSRFILKDESIPVRLMEYDNTDFNNSYFDLVYSQGGISSRFRNKIIKEIKRILKPGGILSAGEIVSLQIPVPEFIKDIWEADSIYPMQLETINNYYTERGFELIAEKDLSASLKEFYNSSKNLLMKHIVELSESEKSYYKKLIKKINHEADAYLKLGGEKYIGFVSLVLRKES